MLLDFHSRLRAKSVYPPQTLMRSQRVCRDLTLLLAIFFISSVCATAETSRVAVTLDGQVTSATQQPIAGASVQLFNTDDQVVADTVTDAQGNYLLVGVPLVPGRYNLVVAHADFLPKTLPVDAAKRPNEQEFKLSAELTPSAGYSGWGWPFGKKKKEDSAPQAYVHMKVFYATDRAHIVGGPGYANSASEDGSTHLGTADVTIPATHNTGSIETPSLWHLEFNALPDRHVSLDKIEETKGDDFYKALKKAVKDSDGKTAFVFIHGYNVSFDQAVIRTAQMAYDLKFDGAPIVYSWPSHALVAGYPLDEGEIEKTQPHLKQFLHDVAEKSGAKSVYVIAHSMGNRAMLAVMDRLESEDKKVDKVVKQVVFAAPDVDAQKFRGVAERLAKQPPHVTLYVSTKDQALLISHRFHRDMARAGEGGAHVVIVPGMDTVDVTAVDTEPLGHSYYGDSRSVIGDLIRLFKNEVLPRGLTEASTAGGKYWVFPGN